MDNSSNTKNNSQNGYTQQEFNSRLNKMLKVYGISALSKEQNKIETLETRVYEIKLNPPRSNK